MWGARGWIVAVAAAALGGSSASSLPARADVATSPSTFVAQYAAALPEPARASVAAGLRLWSQRLVSAVPVEIEVRWEPLPRGVAGAAQPLSYAQATPDGPMDPVALANAVAGFDHDPGADVQITLNSNERWSYGEGIAAAGTTDMVSFVLHEVAHGLGLIGSFTRQSDDPHSLGWGRLDPSGVRRPVGMDRFVIDADSGDALIAAFENPSPALFAAASGLRVVWGGEARDAGGRPIQLYAPYAYEDHSSLVHLDDNAYPMGHPDALMTSLIRRGEWIRQVGPAALGMLADLGWTVIPEPVDAPRVTPQAQVAPVPVSTVPTSAPTTVVVVAALVDTAYVPEAVQVPRPEPGARSRSVWVAIPMLLALAGVCARMRVRVRQPSTSTPASSTS